MLVLFIRCASSLVVIIFSNIAAFFMLTIYANIYHHSLACPSFNSSRPSFPFFLPAHLFLLFDVFLPFRVVHCLLALYLFCLFSSSWLSAFMLRQVRSSPCPSSAQPTRWRGVVVEPPFTLVQPSWKTSTTSTRTRIPLSLFFPFSLQSFFFREPFKKIGSSFLLLCDELMMIE